MHHLSLHHVNRDRGNLSGGTEASADNASIPRLLGLSHHTELGDEVERLLDVQVQWLQRRINADLILVEALRFSDALQRFNRATDKVRNVVYTSEDFGVRVALNKLEQLAVYHLYAGYLVAILIEYLVLAEHFVFFRDVLFCESVLQFITTLLQL